MREREGYLVEKNGRFSVRYWIDEKKRPSVALPTCRSEDEARARMRIVVGHVEALRAIQQYELAEYIAKKAAVARDAVELEGVARTVRAIVLGEAKPKVELSKGMTFKAFAQKWTSGELHVLYPKRVRAKATAANDESTLRKHVYPVIGDVPLASVTLQHGESVLSRMPASLSEATVRHVAQAMAKTMAYAAYPALLIERSPFPPGFLPKVTRRVAFTYLYPDEDAQLLACTEIPLVWRLLYGFLMREGLRISEAKRLEWSDLDLRRGSLSLDKNKTNDPRMWAMGEGVVEALTRYRRIAPSTTRVFTYEDGRSIAAAGRADEMREFARRAGLTRRQIHERSDERRPLRIHDFRATFVTIALATGRTERWVADRTGHRSSDQIAKYTRMARTHAELKLGELRTLAEAVPELASLAADQGRRDVPPASAMAFHANPSMSPT